MDETYIRAGGKWRYMWRAIDANGQLLGFQADGPMRCEARRGESGKSLSE
nr:DDE-type integrase/transposase/recombinase [Roseobacter litoralis]